MSSPPRPRGQSLVLASLYVLLLVVMVLMTLGISQRVREKIELNTIAETTAYSNAVATARAYNAVALMNRAAIAHWINLAGVESLISWTGLLFAQYYAVMQSVLPNEAFGYAEYTGGYVLGMPQYTANAECQQAMANVLFSPLYDAYWDLGVNWVTFLDDAAKAGEQGRRLQDAIGNLKNAELGIVSSLRGQVGGHQLGTQIARLAQQADVGGGLSSFDARNVSPWLDPPQTGLHSDKVWWAVMDARSPWVKNRSNDPILRLEQALNARFAQLFAGPYDAQSIFTRKPWETVRVTGSVTFDFKSHGHGCFGADFATCESGPDWTNALAQDWSTTTVTIAITGVNHVANLDGRQDVPSGSPGCPGYSRTVSKSNESRVLASDIHHDDDYAWFDFASYGGAATTYGATSPVMSQLTSKAITQHTMGPCTDDFLLRPCHSVYVGIVSLDQGAPLGGQAKNYAGATRDHSRHAAPGTRDPWDVKLRFAFAPGPGSAIDLGKGGDEPAVAVGTGIAYYHRRGHFTETPNLFNPYWRATLIGARRGVDDLPALPGTAAAAWAELKGAGYRGEN